MILGVLMYDLTRVDDIVLVERARLDRIFEEQELKLSGLLNNVDTAKQVGQMAGADALIEGSYAFLGGDMMINLSLMTVDEGKTIPLSVRGQTENTVHNLAEQIVEALLGRSVILAGEEGERSLLSLSDEEPGSIEFYCNFIQGEIYVDDKFLRIHAGRNNADDTGRSQPRRTYRSSGSGKRFRRDRLARGCFS